MIRRTLTIRRTVIRGRHTSTTETHLVDDGSDPAAAKKIDEAEAAHRGDAAETEAAFKDLDRELTGVFDRLHERLRGVFR